MTMDALPDPRPDWALFLDFDGTLVEIAERPDAVHLDDRIAAAVSELAARLGGALALISGRPVADLDSYFGRRFPAAGLHGLELRPDPGAPARRRPSPPALATVRTSLGRFAAAHDGVWLEDKGVTLALHYRRRQELAEPALAAVEAAMDGTADLRAMRGKMVVEVKPAGIDKGTAIVELMETPPFLGRMPVFAGDDLTDEDGFVAVERLGGFGIKVGNGDSIARYRIASVADFGAWLDRSARRLGIPQGVDAP